MSVRVIKERKSPDQIAKQFDCRQCTSTLEYVPAEHKRVYEQRDGDYYVIDCPVCRCRNYLGA